MAAVEQPTNATAPREAVSGEAAQIEEQASGAPTGPERRGRPAKPLEIETGPALGEGTIPENNGAINDVVPVRGNVMPATRARPASVEEQVSLAMLGLGTLTTTGRRFAMALAGFGQPGLPREVPPRNLYAGMPEEPLPNYAPPEGAQPLSAEETAAESEALAGVEGGQ